MVRFEAPEDQLTQERLENPSAGGGSAGPGKAHLLVLSVDVSQESAEVVFEVLAHEDESEVGKKSYNRFYYTRKSANRAAQYATACGVYSWEQYENECKVGQLNIPLERTEGQSFCGLLKNEKSNNDKTYCRVKFDFFSVSSPAAADYPKNEEYVNQKQTVPALVDPDDIVF